MAAAVDLHVAGIVSILFFSDFTEDEDENLPRLGSHCIYHAGML